MLITPSALRVESFSAVPMHDDWQLRTQPHAETTGRVGRGAEACGTEAALKTSGTAGMVRRLAALTLLGSHITEQGPEHRHRLHTENHSD